MRLAGRRKERKEPARREVMLGAARKVARHGKRKGDLAGFQLSSPDRFFNFSPCMCMTG